MGSVLKGRERERERAFSLQPVLSSPSPLLYSTFLPLFSRLLLAAHPLLFYFTLTLFAHFPFLHLFLLTLLADMAIALCSPLRFPFSETSNQWSTWVPLLPGTHHIRFLVDGVATIAEDLPTTVDDNGSLANYVSVPISSSTPPSTSVQVIPAIPRDRDREHDQTLNQTQAQMAAPTTGNGNSFFADAEAQKEAEDGAWTDKVPWQLECAAEEEEQWLNHSHSHAHSHQHQIPPPQHPQAPSLPRHLEKLIMNQRPPTGARAVGGGGAAGAGKPSGSSTALFGDRGSLPVTTASGTNLSATASKKSGSSAAASSSPYTKLNDAPTGVHAGPGLADDGSVLPVPSHVVLHHLGTSAIRNGVLAVADTVRYRKKVRWFVRLGVFFPLLRYCLLFTDGFVLFFCFFIQYITTIYYKPT
jgi:hypothetical protein